jgi:hypothetical protein
VRYPVGFIAQPKKRSGSRRRAPPRPYSPLLPEVAPGQQPHSARHRRLPPGVRRPPSPASTRDARWSPPCAALLFLCGYNASAMNSSKANSSGVAAQRRNGVWLLGNWGRGGLQGRAVERCCERRPVELAAHARWEDRWENHEGERRWEEEDKVKDWVPRARTWYSVNLFA